MIKQRIFSTCILLSFFVVPLTAKIIEMNHMQSLQHHLSNDALVIFDIDNTIMEPTQELGSDQWFRYRIQKYIGQGSSPDQALENALAEWEAVQHLTKVKLVENYTADLVKQLQDKKYAVIGLTTRGLSLATRTVQQLQSLSVDLSKTCFVNKETSFLNPHTVLLRKGILFTSGTHKGNAFFKLLDETGYRPKKIIFINDKATHLREIEEVAEKRKVPFLGLRYSYLDYRVKNFQAKLADLQFENFGQILSDREAEKQLLDKKAKL